MDDLAKLFSMTWPILAVCAAGLAIVFIVLKGSIAGLQRTLSELRERQEKIHAKVGELDRRYETVGKQQADAMARLTDTQRELAEHKTAYGQQLAALDLRVGGRRAGDEGESDGPISMERFNAAAETLSQLAKELDGFDARHGENWLSIKGDIDEQGFQLQRVQQHVDKLFDGASADAQPSGAPN